MKIPLSIVIPVSLVALLVAYVLIALANTWNPDSIFCHFRIFRQPDGTYEVWADGRIPALESKHQTYEEAKAAQIKRCDDMKLFLRSGPKGERMR